MGLDHEEKQFINDLPKAKVVSRNPGRSGHVSAGGVMSHKPGPATYDEELERPKFEKALTDESVKRSEYAGAWLTAAHKIDGEAIYHDGNVQSAWWGWKACAKERDGGVE